MRCHHSVGQAIRVTILNQWLEDLSIAWIPYIFRGRWFRTQQIIFVGADNTITTRLYKYFSILSAPTNHVKNSLRTVNYTYGQSAVQKVRTFERLHVSCPCRRSDVRTYWRMNYPPLVIGRSAHKRWVFTRPDKPRKELQVDGPLCKADCPLFKMFGYPNVCM